MRYQKIESKIWNDEKFIALTPMQQRLFFYVLTSPHNNLIGLYVLKAGYACEDLDITNRDFNRDLKCLCDNDLVEYDKTLKVIFIINFLIHNPITNPNQKKAAVKLLSSLPRTQLIQTFLGTYEGLGKELTNSLGLVLSKPEAEAEAGTEEEEEEETESKEDLRAREKIYARFSEKFWELYPKRNGRKSGKGDCFEYIEQKIKEVDFQALLKATTNYSVSSSAKTNFATDPIRFLKKDKWREWIEGETVEPEEMTSREKHDIAHEIRETKARALKAKIMAEGKV